MTILLLIPLAGLIACAGVLGTELFREANRMAEAREAEKKAQVQYQFNGKSWLEEELIIRRLLKKGM